jgi:hypothetical protein
MAPSTCSFNIESATSAKHPEGLPELLVSLQLDRRLSISRHFTDIFGLEGVLPLLNETFVQGVAFLNLLDIRGLPHVLVGLPVVLVEVEGLDYPGV